MEAKDMWLLLAGAVLGYVINLTATFTAPSVGTAFGKLKSGFIERNKARALAAYAEVRDLKSGKRDKYLYAISHWGLVTFLYPTSFLAAFIVFAARRAIGPDSFYQAQENAPAFWLFVSAIAASLIFAVVSGTLRVVLTLSRLENFEDYRAELLRRWPDIELPDPE
jgi:hypothetical protein